MGLGPPHSGNGKIFSDGRLAISRNDSRIGGKTGSEILEPHDVSCAYGRGKQYPPFQRTR